MQLPVRLGKYELVEFLGGGMSHVYRAIDTVIGRTVAVKILTPEASSDEEARTRFLHEARMAGNISHENIVNIYDFGEADGCPYLVMEFLSGQNLLSMINKGESGDLKRRLDLALQAARALDYVHSVNIIHRDVKPENMNVSDKGVLKLMDFGVAKVEHLSHTQPGYMLGTPYYMAPEQVKGAPVTKAIDIYAFGVVLFELITGAKPFKADTVEQIFYRILMEPIDLTPVRNTSAPQALVDLIERCISKDPAQRPQSFAQIADRLQQIIDELNAPLVSSGPTMIVERLQPKQVTWLAPAIGIAVALALIAVYFGVVRPRITARKVEPLAKTLSTPVGEMLLIPAGVFKSGDQQADVTVPDFYIDKTEVTNAAYQKYAQERHHAMPEGFPSDKPQYPVVNITFDDAKDFAAWAHKRLPSMIEWEKAARGTDGRKYPWGNEADATRANLANDGGAWPADKSGGDISPYGILNMGGNVAEFTDQLRTPSDQAVKGFEHLLTPPPTAQEPWCTVRGGSFRQPLPSAITYEWGSVPTRFHTSSIGFRCARDSR
ncbi:MAG TPA: bifunctional serine/threonine-protein kinase/formylglycine-generating enzyme family protein [Bryobacteraceae bacterium]|nr:bifunctional serine/threonine-protein kinase/formylglycine-generating enzyme family protein [Bryobacteraceae bacterium]